MSLLIDAACGGAIAGVVWFLMFSRENAEGAILAGMLGGIVLGGAPQSVPAMTQMVTHLIYFILPLAFFEGVSLVIGGKSNAGLVPVIRVFLILIGTVIAFPKFMG